MVGVVVGVMMYESNTAVLVISSHVNLSIGQLHRRNAAPKVHGVINYHYYDDSISNYGAGRFFVNAISNVMCNNNTSYQTT